uniref:Orc1-like AAA ATPase domain-containing protein n=1 Tax=Sinocyclocheilus rhinocerous TaxID=307959 RepID=A0A673H4N7_9TELE
HTALWLTDCHAETQLKSLLSLMGQVNQYSYPSIFIYGHRATGKSHVVLSIMKDLEVRTEIVLCFVQIPTLAVIALDHLTTYMTYFLYLGQVFK